MNIFIGSLPFSLREEELRGFFEEYGEVASAKIITDKFTGRSRGFGFVEMPVEEEARKAIAELNGAEVDGRTIVVNESEEKETATGEAASEVVTAAEVAAAAAAVLTVAAAVAAAEAVVATKVAVTSFGKSFPGSTTNV